MNIADGKRIEKKMLELRKIWIGIKKSGKKLTKNFQLNFQVGAGGSGGVCWWGKGGNNFCV